MAFDRMLLDRFMPNGSAWDLIRQRLPGVFECSEALSGLCVRGRSRSIANPFPVVMAGGAFHAVPWLQDALRARLADVEPAADVRLLDTEPALGAVRLALAEAAGGAVIPTYTTRDHLPL